MARPSDDSARGVKFWSYYLRRTIFRLCCPPKKATNSKSTLSHSRGGLLSWGPRTEPAFKKLREAFRKSRGVDLTFPNDQDVPPGRSEGVAVCDISGPVPFEFGLPVAEIRTWDMGEPALGAMLMPETSVHKNHLATTGKDHIGPAWESVLV